MTLFWVNFFEAKPEYLQYCIAHSEYDSVSKTKLFHLLFKAAQQSIQVYKSIYYLALRFKMASELIKSLIKDYPIDELNHLTPNDETLKRLVNTRIFERAITNIQNFPSLPSPAYSDNPNTFFLPTKSQAKRDKALRNKEKKEKTNSKFENRYGSKEKIFQP